MSPTSQTARSSRPKVPAPTVVLLVRHGITPTTGKVLPGRAPGLHLAPKGREQAARVAERIGAIERKPTALYASPLDRTKETAAPTAKALGLRIQIDRGLLECNVGDWTGKTLKSLYKAPLWGAVQRWPGGFRFPGGESFAEMSTRCTEAILGLVARHPGETILAFSHADPIKAIVANAQGTPLDLFQRIVISPCSVSALLFGAGGPHVLCVNSTGSLNELALS